MTSLSDAASYATIALPIAAVVSIILGYYLQARLQNAKLEATALQSRLERRGLAYADLYRSLGKLQGYAHILSTYDALIRPYFPSVDGKPGIAPDQDAANRLAWATQELTGRMGIVLRPELLPLMASGMPSNTLGGVNEARSTMRRVAYQALEDASSDLIKTSMTDPSEDVTRRAWAIYLDARRSLREQWGTITDPKMAISIAKLSQLLGKMRSEAGIAAPKGDDPFEKLLFDLLEEELPTRGK